MVLSVLEAHCGQDYLAVDSVLWVDEVDIAGGADWYPQLLAKCDDTAVVVTQFLVVTGDTLPDHELVIADRLYLQIIVELRQFLDTFLRLLVHHSPEKFAGFAGASEDKTLPVFLED